MKYNELAVSVQLFNNKDQDNARKASLASSLELAVILLMKGRNDRFEQGLNACSTRGNGQKIRVLIEHVQSIASSHRADQKEKKLLDANGNVVVAPLIDYEGLVAACFTLNVEQKEKKMQASIKREETKKIKEETMVKFKEKAEKVERLELENRVLEQEIQSLTAIKEENKQLAAQNTFLLDLIEQIKQTNSLKGIKALLSD
jgi:hypothetical protein